jgi:hypothetical protein
MLDSLKYLLKYLNRDVITIIAKYVLFSGTHLATLHDQCLLPKTFMYLDKDRILCRQFNHNNGDSHLGLISIKNNKIKCLKQTTFEYFYCNVLTRVDTNKIVIAATLNKDMYYIIDILSLQIEHIFNIKKDERSSCLISFFRNNITYLILGMCSGLIIIYDLTNFKIVKTFNAFTSFHSYDNITQLSILEKHTKEEARIISGSLSGKIIILDYNFDSQFKNLFKKNRILDGHKSMITSIIFINDMVISASQYSLKIHNVLGKEILKIKDEFINITSMCIIDENLVIACSKALRFYDLDNFKLIKTINTENTCSCLQVSKDNRLITLEEHSYNFNIYN